MVIGGVVHWVERLPAGQGTFGLTLRCSGIHFYQHSESGDWSSKLKIILRHNVNATRYKEA